MPAEEVKMKEPARRKVYVEGVPFTEVALQDGDAVRLYDTSGPGSEPDIGLPPLRRDWIVGRGDVEEYEGRRVVPQDNGYLTKGAEDIARVKDRGTLEE